MYFSLLTVIVCLKQSTKIIDLYLIKSLVLIHCYTKHFINLIHSLWYQYQYILLLLSFLPLEYIFFLDIQNLIQTWSYQGAKIEIRHSDIIVLTTNKFSTTTSIFLAIHNDENILLFSQLNGELFYVCISYSNNTHHFYA